MINKIKEKIKDLSKGKLLIGTLGVCCIGIILIFAIGSITLPTEPFDKNQIFKNNLDYGNFSDDGIDYYLTVYGFTDLNENQLSNFKGYTVKVESLNKDGTVSSSIPNTIPDLYPIDGKVFFSSIKLNNNLLNDVDKIIVTVTDDSGNIVQTIEKKIILSQDTSSNNENSSSKSDSKYQIRITYDGEWTGLLEGENPPLKYTGYGTKTIDITNLGYDDMVVFSVEKSDFGSGILKVELLKDGAVVQEKSAYSYEIAVIDYTK
jgi:hypothetical protein